MLKYEVSDAIARITMCNPPVNALSRPWAESFFEVLDALDNRDDWRVLIIGSDQKVFSAGGDIKQFAGRLEQQNAGNILAEEAGLYQTLFSRISNLTRVSIAEIAGVAAGGGMELALACDLRVASETTKLGLPEVGIGLLPAGGGTQRMTKLCGRGRALRLIGCAELVSGKEAVSLGLAEWAFPADEVRSQTLNIARRLADQPPEALLAAKACIAAAQDGSVNGFALELSYPPVLMKSPATQKRIRDFLSTHK